jgi:tRNA pseudouridine-54 N-methylase
MKEATWNHLSSFSPGELLDEVITKLAKDDSIVTLTAIGNPLKSYEIRYQSRNSGGCFIFTKHSKETRTVDEILTEIGETS